MYQCLLLDDDQAFLKDSANLLSKLFQREGLAMECRLLSDPTELFQKNQTGNIFFDLAILDVEMPHYSGIEVAKLLRKINPHCLILFLTSHRELAVDAYELSIFRFIPKEDLRTRMPRYVPQIKEALGAMKTRQLTFSDGADVVRLAEETIILIKKEKKYSVFYLKGGTTRKLRTSLESIKHKLNNDTFVHPDRGVLVNIANVEQTRGSTLICAEQHEVEISRRKSSSVKEKLLVYWGKQI